MEEVGNAFNAVAATVNSGRRVSVRQFSDACSRFLRVFGVLDASFNFAQTDLVPKVRDLAQASQSISTLEEMIDRDIGAGREMSINSHTRNLLNIKRGLQLINVFCGKILSTRGESSLKTAALTAYYEVLYSYHEPRVQQQCVTALNNLPPRSSVLAMIGKTEETVQIHLQRYVAASTPVIAYVDRLFTSRNLST